MSSRCRFASNEIMHELHTAMYAPLIGRRCDSCVIKTCDQPFAISDKGYPISGTTAPTDPTAVVRWPKCPKNWEILRPLGFDHVPLDQHIRFAYEREQHKAEHLSAGGIRLFREWLNIRGTIDLLLKVHAHEEARRKRPNR